MSESSQVIQTVVNEVSSVVSKMAGIQLGPKQFSMVENRLRTRMTKLGMKNFQEYLNHLKANSESESQALLSLLTTHHTYFFREFSHFEFMLNKSLPTLIDNCRAKGRKKIRIWSAASSRGQEVYSLAMFFRFHLNDMAPDLDFEILGTDVDPESVAHGKNGVYRAEELKQAPAMYVMDNWVRGSGKVRDFSKVKDHLKSKCHFDVLNILDPKKFLQGQEFDIIFCRNVFIYFNQEQIRSCTENFLRHLNPWGFLFLGVSESLHGLNLQVQTVAPAVYQKPQSQKPQSTIPAKELPKIVERTSPFEVLCVDDSPVILTLLKKILTPDTGFVVKATASNGQEALDIVKTQKFDVMTLDLHMPEVDGLGFLTQTKNTQRPPVVIVSAINRDDPSIAQKALGLGAADYVEKPSLENIAQAGNEIRSKLKLVLSFHNKSVAAAGTPGAVTPGPSPAASPPVKSEPPPRQSGTAVKTLTKASAAVNPKISTSSSSSLSKAASAKKKVLVVDDSVTIRNLLKKIINQDPGLEVVAEAELPSKVESLIKAHKPDVITLDIHMPEMDGVTLLKKIHPQFHIPTVMISSISKEEGPQVLSALESGAIDYIQKPSMSDLGEVAQLIREKIKIASQAKIQTKKASTKKLVAGNLDREALVLIGSSTGGTEALKVVLESMPSQIPPILIVQHIPPVFSAAFAKRLNELCAFEVKEAAHGDEVKANRVLIAPGGSQMAIKSRDGKLSVEVTDAPPMNRHKPSVDFLFQSVAEINHPRVVAAILTGMGADGAAMLKKLRDQGARTVAQDKDTSVVYGMPREAFERGGAEFVRPLSEIAEALLHLSSSGQNKAKKAA